MLFPDYKAPLFKMIAFDPGGKKTGVSVFLLDIPKKEIVSIRSWTIHVDGLKNDTGLPEEIFDEKVIRRYKLRNEIQRIFLEENPYQVCYEGPFMNRLQPSAYGPLVAVMTLIQDALISYAPGVPFMVIQPQQGKKGVGVAGKKGKDVMRQAVKSIPVLIEALKRGNCLLDELDEHAVDSIAVGYTCLQLDIFKGVP